jgi:hypothetical protein
VVDFEVLGVQEVASVAGETREIFQRLSGWPVQRVAHQRMADGSQVDPDLMGAA